MPLYPPTDIIATDVAGEFVDMDQLHHVTFLFYFGAMTSDSTDTATITIQACDIATTTDSTETEIDFHYRLTAAAADDTVGAVTTCDTAGYAVTAEQDGKIVIVDVDAEAVAAAVSGAGRFVRPFITTNAEMASCLVSIIAIGELRYPRNIPNSST